MDAKAYETMVTLIKKQSEWTTVAELQRSLEDKELLKTMLVSLFVENIVEVELTN